MECTILLTIETFHVRALSCSHNILQERSSRSVSEQRVVVTDIIQQSARHANFFEIRLIMLTSVSCVTSVTINYLSELELFGHLLNQLVHPSF